MKEESKMQLAESLKAERDHFEARGGDTTEHDVAIKYLQTGYKPNESEHFELLTAVIEDFKTVCSDYGVRI